MIPKLELQLRKIEIDLADSLNKLPKPASEYTVKHLIRERVLQVHNLGSTYAAKHFGLKHFNTANDFLEIGKIADDVYRVFTYAKNQEAALIALTSITLAKAVKSKAKQISEAIKNNDIDKILEVDSNNLAYIMTAAAPTKIPGLKQIELKLPIGTALQPYSPSHVKQIELQLGFPLPTPISPPSEIMPIEQPPVAPEDQQPTTTTITDLFIWRTEQDALVCPICQPLEGQTWELDDPDIPTPIEDTHPNCRCRIELTTEET